ncbi:MAG: tetratricopeptide repeat protein [Phycisphaerae bacterium]
MRPWLIVPLACALIHAALPGAAAAPGTTQPARLPRERGLRGDDASHVDALRKRITALRNKLEFATAIPLAEEVVQTRTRLQGADHWETVDARQVLADLRLRQSWTDAQQATFRDAYHANERGVRLFSAGRIEPAEEQFRRAVELRKSLFKGDHPSIALSMDNRAAILRAGGKFREADEVSRAAIEMFRRMSPPDHPEIATALNTRAQILADLDQLDAAEKLCREALTMRRALFAGDDPAIAESLNNLAVMLRKRGRLDQAESLYRESLEMHRRLLPKDHPAIATSLGNLGTILQERGALDEAEPLLREALAIRMRRARGDHPDVAVSLETLGVLLLDRGALDEAESALRHAATMFQHVLPADHPVVAQTLGNLALVLEARGSPDQAEQFAVSALAMLRRLFPGDHSDVAEAMSKLAHLLRNRGALDQAEVLLRDAVAMRERLHRGDDSQTAADLIGLANTLLARGDLDQAEVCCRRADEIISRLPASDAWERSHGKFILAGVLQRRGRFLDAERLIRECMSAVRQRPGSKSRSLYGELQNLSAVLYTAGKLDQAESVAREALARCREISPADSPNLAYSQFALGYILQARGSYDQAEPLMRQAFDMSERLRTQVTGGEQDRALFAAELELSERAVGFAALMIHLQRDADAFAILERGRSRAALDLVSRGGRDLAAEVKSLDSQRAARLDAATAAEAAARTALLDAESLLAGFVRQRAAWAQMADKSDAERAARVAEFDRRIAEQTAAVETQRFALTRAGAAVLAELRGFIPAGQALATEEILSRLKPDQALVSFAFGRDFALCAVAARGCSRAAIVADGKPAVDRLASQLSELRAAIAQPGGAPAGRSSPLEAARRDALRATLLPVSVAAPLANVPRWVVLPDGPLTDVPLELLWPDAPQAPQITYAPSATVYFDRCATQHAPAAGRPAAIILADPEFGTPSGVPPAPPAGILLAAVVPQSPAASAGLRRGDVLTRYADRPLRQPTDLAQAMQQLAAASQPANRTRGIALRYWRDGATHDIDVPAGKLGVRLDAAPPAEGLRSMRLLDPLARGGYASAPATSATEQVRLFGDQLGPLPGTRREAQAIAAVLAAADHAPTTPAAGGSAFGRPGAAPAIDVTLLLGGDATLPGLWQQVQTRPPRYLHFATHGLMGSAAHPLDASLALTAPSVPTPDDLGFLRLDDLLSHWGGRLRECDLVVLSACDTQRGARRGDSVMSLPLGFFFAGTPTVIASLWKVDDLATQLLMTRFYENLVGQSAGLSQIAGGHLLDQPAMTKADALRAARRWLGALTWQQAERASGLSRDAFRRYRLSRGAADEDKPSQRGVASRPAVAPRTAEPALPAAEDRPFAHPYYWSAFILVGKPD